MLTVMGKMVQQIATINNLLIFINIQISQLQKSNEGRALGEGTRYGRNLITPSKGWGRPGLLPVLGGVGGLLYLHLGPSSLISGDEGVGGGWNGTTPSVGQGQARPCPGLQCARPRSQSCLSCPWGAVPRAGQAWQPLPPVSDVFRGRAACQPPGTGCFMGSAWWL